MTSHPNHLQDSGANLFDYAASVKARDVGLADVTTHNAKWAELILAFIDGLPRGWTGLGEDIRKLWYGPQPDHPNAWGAVIRVAVARKLLEKTGARQPMSAVTSHARLTDQYRRT